MIVAGEGWTGTLARGENAAQLNLLDFYKNPLPTGDDTTVITWGQFGSADSKASAGCRNATAIVMNYADLITLKTNGTVFDVQPNPYSTVGFSDSPNTITNAVGVAAGGGHFFAVKGDGTITAWGLNQYGETTIPPSLTGVTAVAAGPFHTLALKSDGTVVAWGYNGYGETVVPANLSGVTAIAAGSLHSVAQKSDGSVVAWGQNVVGESTVPTGLTGVTAISTGDAHTLALKGDGTVVSWGYNNYGQTTVPAGLGGVVAVAAGKNHSVALKKDGTIIAWGNNSSHQTNVPTGLGDVSAVAAGGDSTAVIAYVGGTFGATPSGTSRDHTFYLKPGGNLALANVSGLIEGPDADQFSLPHGVPGTVNFSAYPDFTPNPSFPVRFAPTRTGTLTALLKIFSNDPASPFILPLKGTGIAQVPVTAVRLQTSGIGGADLQFPSATVDLGQVDGETTVQRSFTLQNSGTETLTHLRVVIQGESPLRVVQGLPATLAPGASATFTVSFQGEGGFGAETAALQVLSDLPDLQPETITFQAVVSYVPKLAVVDAFGNDISQNMGNHVITWGYDPNGEVTPPAGLTDVAALAAGNGHVLALRQDGTTIDWRNGYTAIAAGPGGIAAVAAGFSTAVGLKSDGTVVAWGWDGYGETNVPSGLGNVVAISANGNHTLALKSDGTVAAWGKFFNNGAWFNETLPMGLGSVTAIAAGFDHSVALKRDGTIVAWGIDSVAQPPAPTGLHGVVALAAGSGHTVALQSDGTVADWGDASSVVPAGLGGVVAISAGFTHTLALKSDGTVAAWGTVLKDYLTEVPASVPDGLSQVTAIAAGLYFSAAVVESTGGHFGSVAPGKSRALAMAVKGLGIAALLNLNAVITGPDADQFSADAPLPYVINVGAQTPFTVRFNPTRPGLAVATLTINCDYLPSPYVLPLQGFGMLELIATSAHVPGSPFTYGPLTPDRLTGLMLQKLSFTNPTDIAINGLRLILSKVAAGIGVYSSSMGAKPGTLDVLYTHPIAAGATVRFSLVYLDPQRRTASSNNPVITAEALPDPVPAPGPVGGTLIKLLFIRDTPEGPLLEWNTMRNSQYVVEYSDDQCTTWHSAVHRLGNGGSRMFWVDRGQPETQTSPLNKASRMYRVKKL